MVPMYNINMSNKWIQKAIGEKGGLHRMLNVPSGTKIPAKKMSEALNSGNPLERKRAVLARTLSNFHK